LCPIVTFKSPIVTHGHTFCTSISFEEVAKAVNECAFVTSNLPVILSLEMHCSPKQQYRLARIMIAYLPDTMLPVRQTCNRVESLTHYMHSQ